MGRHSASSTPQARSRAIQRNRRARHGRRVPLTSRLTTAVTDRLADATAAASLKARRAGISTAAVRPAGIVASSAIVLGAAMGGVIAVNSSVPPAQAAELAPAAATAASTGASTGSVVVDGQTHELDASAATLGDALREAGIVVDADDKVSAELSGPVPAETVTITRVTTQIVTDRRVDAHGTSEVKDPNLPKGERAVRTAGVDGVENVVSSVTLDDGTESARAEIARVTEAAKVDEVIAVGTKEAPAPAPAAAPSQGSSAAAAPAGPAASGSPKAIAAQMVSARGWGSEQMACLDNLWTKESNWTTTAANPTSSAYGIPQALPGSKMASAGADWRTNPATQITWGLGYISDRYGTPCAAWGHSQAKNWY